MVSTIDNVLRVQYQGEWVQDFERSTAKLRRCVNSKAAFQAKQAIFPILNPSDSAIEKTRDGRIPSSDLSLTNATATLRRHHKKYQIDDFDAFRSQADLRTAMSMKGVAAVNRAIDQVIIDQLDTATSNMGSAAALSTLAEVMDWVTTLWEADVPNDDGKVWGIVTPRAWAQMMRITEFKSFDYINQKPADVGLGVGVRSWMGVNWMQHTGLTGKGTSSAKCYLFHESVIGHAISGDPEAILFTNEEDEYFGVRYRVTHAAKLLLQTGIIQYLHDDTAALA